MPTERIDSATVSSFAVATGLSVGLLDVAVGYFQLTGLRFILPQLAPFFGTVVPTVAVGFAVSWWAALGPIGRKWQLDEGALLVSLSASFHAMFAGIVLIRWERPLASKLELVGPVVLGLVVLVMARAILRRKPLRTAPSPVTALRLFVLGAATLGLIIALRHAGGAVVPVRVVSVALYLAAAFGTLVAAADKRRVRLAELVLFGAFGLALVAPFLPSSSRRSAPSVERNSPETGRIRHVFLIVVDTLRADAVSLTGAVESTTPNIDALAADGVSFVQARAAGPWTMPSMASMLTGVSPLVHGATGTFSALPETLPTLAEILAEAGYRTAAFGTNAFLLPRSGLGRGFDEYDFYPRLGPEPPLAGLIFRALAPDRLRDGLSAAELTNRAAAWLDERGEESFFLWLHYFDPHLPYAPPPRYVDTAAQPSGMGTSWNDFVGARVGYRRLTPERRSWIETLYRAEVRYLDDQIGALVRKLRQLELYEESLIVLTSDHGEELWDHGGFEHGHTLFDELLRVPLIVKLPRSEVTGRSQTPVSVESIAPTILSLCQVSYDEAGMTGTRLLAGDGELVDDSTAAPVLSTGTLYFEDRAALVRSEYKYVRFSSSGKEELYDLARDPGERVSIASDAPEVVDDLRRLHGALEKKALAIRQRYGITAERGRAMEEATKERLRELGYVP